MAEVEGTTRREARKAEVRQRILDNCIVLLGQKPFQAITIQDICKAANVARQTFYNHFETKDDVLEEISQVMFFDGSIAAFTDALALHSGTQARLDYTFGRLMDPIKTYQGENAQVIVQLIQNMTRGIRRNGQQLSRYHKGVSEYFAACAEADDTCDDFDIDFIADLVVNASVGIVLSWVDDQEYPAQDRINALNQHICQTILR